MGSSDGTVLFQELVELKDVQQLQADFSAATGLTTSILDPSGRVLTGSGWTDLCAAFHRDSPVAAARCLESNQRLLAEAARKQGEVIQVCANGLVMAARPIVVAGYHLATIILSQVFFEPPDEDYFRAQARTFGLDEGTYLEAVRSVPVLPKEEFLPKLRFIGNLAGLISSQGRRNWEQKALHEELEAANEELVAVNEELMAAEEELRQQLGALERAQEQIKTQKAYFEQLFENSPLAIVMLDNQARVICANRGFEGLFQYSSAEIAGRPIDEIVIPSELSDEGAAFSRTTREGGILQGESVRKRKDGSLVDVGLLGYPIVVGNQVVGAYAIYNDITARKQAQTALRESEARLKTVLDSIQSGVVVIDAETHRIVSANRVAVEMIGCSPNDIFGSLCHQSICAAEKGECPITDRGESIDRSEHLLITDDGENVSIIKTVVPVTFNGHRHLIESFVDITARKQAEEQLRKANALLDGVLDAIPDVVGVQGPEHEMIRFNKAGYRLFELTPEQVEGRKCYDLLGRAGRCQPCATEMAWQSKRMERVEKFFPELGRYFDCRSNPIKDESGEVIMVVEQFYDVTERKLMEEQLRHLSLHDPLTGLYNRTYFEQEMRRAEGTRQVPVGIVVCDVDGLKLVNDTLGHDAGDVLLKAAAGVLKKSFRLGDLVARVGGDEFAVLLPGSGRDIMNEACRRIRESVDSYNAANPGMALSISVGFAVDDKAPVNVNALYREADNNMYRAKLHRSRSARSAIVQTLMKALKARDFITEGHADRLQALVVSMASALGQPEGSVGDLRLLAQFHDIGKVGIPDRILFKPGALTPDEMVEMRRHSEIGHRIALSSPDLIPIADWILKHHEWWNGMGYPLGLKGEEIPLECRILAIADAYDAMTSDRPYRRATAHRKAVNELKNYAGVQFDPTLVKTFVELFDEQATA